MTSSAVRLLRVISIALFPLACQSGGDRGASSQAPAAASVAPSNVVRLGAPMAAGQAIPLARLAKDAKSYGDHPVKTEGKVTAVCQAMGCWMELSDADTQVHIRMTGHSFFVPKNASGRRAVVEGKLLAKPDNGECEQEAEQ